MSYDDNRKDQLTAAAHTAADACYSAIANRDAAVRLHQPPHLIGYLDRRVEAAAAAWYAAWLACDGNDLDMQ